MTLRCSECDVDVRRCDCPRGEGRERFAALHDFTLSADQQADRDEERRVEARAREMARAFARSGAVRLEVPAKFVAEVRATLESIARGTNDQAEAARVLALVVTASTDARRAA